MKSIWYGLIYFVASGTAEYEAGTSEYGAGLQLLDSLSGSKTMHAPEAQGQE